MTVEAATPAHVRSHRSRKRMPLLVSAAAATLVLLAVAGVLAPWIAPFDPDATGLRTRLRPPVPLEGSLAAHPLGTDELGRDILSRVLYALRVSLGIAAIGTAIGLAVGTTLGLASGLVRGRLDDVVMMLVDIQIAVPFTLLALTAIAVFGRGTTVLIAIIGFAGWETYARIVRGQVLSIREQPFVEAAQALGARAARVAAVHVLPNVVSPLTVLATVNFGSIVLLESSLSFLGLGVQPPTASLGSMVAAGREFMASAWWLAVTPAAVIVAVAMATSIIGDWLRDRVDARLDA